MDLGEAQRQGVKSHLYQNRGPAHVTNSETSRDSQLQREARINEPFHFTAVNGSGNYLKLYLCKRTFEIPE